MTSTPAKQLPTYAQRVLDLAAHDPQLQQLLPDPAVEDALRAPGLSLEQAIAITLDGYADRPALGERRYELGRDATGRRSRRYQPSFDTITYRALHDRIKGVATAWRCDEQHRVAPGDFVAILGFTGTDYATVDLACGYAQAVSVPLQSTLAGADLDGIFTDTAPTAVAATPSDLVLAAELTGRHESIRSIIATDYDPDVDDDRDHYTAAQAELARNRSAARLTTLSDLVRMGDVAPWQPLPPNDAGANRMALLLHSSGSTGTPKGAIFEDRAARQQFVSAGPVPIVRMVFAPMNHLVGRGMVYRTLAQGGTAYFTAKPDLSMLFDDMRLVRPTEVMVFPRVLEMIHRTYQGELVRRTRDGHADADTVSAQVMAELRTDTLGDRVSLIVVGSAPTTPEIKQFTADCFQVPILDGYGSTEVGPSGIIINNRILRPPVIDYRLRDVPELGYYTTDKPYPRGELCVKTELAIPGYFKRPEATAKLFDEDGYLLTGDIMEERGPDHVVLIDRRNDVLKLTQGEYVAVGALGTTFEDQSAVIQQIYVYGNSARSYLLAVVVPNMDVVASMIGDDPEEPALKALIRAELKKAAAAAKLKSFEVPRDFIVEAEPFTHENGLLSSVHKRMRPSLQRKYGDRLEALYVELERTQSAELQALHDDQSGLSVLEKVGKALEACLGVQGLDIARPSSFAQLGGDSLAAVEFSALLHEIFGVEVSLNTILSPAGSPQQWAHLIEAELDNVLADRPTFAKVHGEGARLLDAADLDVAAFIDKETLEHAALTPPPDMSRTVLLTGATGFLGRFLCLEWLERVAAVDGKVICLIRAADHEAATRRLTAAFEGGDPALGARFHELAADHLEIVVGDVVDERLGQSVEEFARLADEVDHIVHSAALVNHVLGYEDLFGPNVAGTAELIALALTARQKRIDFVSSVATTLLLDRSAGNNEESPLLQQVPLTHDYSAGYATSKWAAEQLLHSAHRRFGLPINVFRGDMMLANRRYAGHINEADIFTRLLYSVIVTGLAPKSFYLLGPDGQRQDAHYDGLPVDFVAAAITGVGAEPNRETRTFHVVNSHEDDGLSLDVFVDWIEEAGYPVHRFTEYDEWLQNFETALKELPEDQRQHSSLAVLESLRRASNPKGAMIGSDNFAAAVRHLPVGPEVPHLNKAFIDKCLADMRLLGLIGEPGR